MTINGSAEISFAKFDPGGNPTVLVDNRRGHLPGENYAAVATQLMAEPFLGAEQVGFMELSHRAEAEGRLVMMGGELCINALRCVAAFLWLEGKTRPLAVEASGTDELVNLSVDADRYTMVASVTVPFRPECRELMPRLTMVSMPGMVHFVESVEEHPGKRDMSRALARAMASSVFRSTPTPDAVGYITAQAIEGGIAIQPLVHVVKTGTTVMETSCGSGSLAAYAIGRYPSGTEILIQQPSGASLSIRSRTDGKLCIAGSVRLSVSGTAHGVTLGARIMADFKERVPVLMRSHG